MADVFEEVEEQLRAEQLRTLGLRALPWVIAALVLALVVALGLWGFDHYRSKAAAEASEQYAAALDAGQRGDNATAKAGMLKVSQSGPKVYRALALLALGGAELAEGKTPEAVKNFDQAATLANDPLLGDLARLKSAFALLDTAPYAEIESRLTPLTADKRPYRTEAKEGLAFAKLLAGKTDEARTDFTVLSVSPDASDDTRQRAEAALSVIDTGAAKALPDAVKAFTALSAMVAPPAAPVPPQGPAQ